MSRSEQGSPQGVERVEQWLGPGLRARSRRWAYADLLLGDGAREDELSALAADLAVDLAELRRLQNEVYDQVVRVAALEGRIQALMHPSADAPVEKDPAPEAQTPPLPSFPSGPANEESGIDAALLVRCEGFEVDSPVGLVGFVRDSGSGPGSTSRTFSRCGEAASAARCSSFPSRPFRRSRPRRSEFSCAACRRRRRTSRTSSSTVSARRSTS